MSNQCKSSFLICFLLVMTMLTACGTRCHCPHVSKTPSESNHQINWTLNEISQGSRPQV